MGCMYKNIWKIKGDTFIYNAATPGNRLTKKYHQSSNTVGYGSEMIPTLSEEDISSIVSHLKKTTNNVKESKHVNNQIRKIGLFIDELG